MTNLPLPSAVELISVHVPKTAGATFGNRILPQIYPSYETDILYDYDNLPVNTLIQQGKMTTKTKVIHGHFSANKYCKHYPNAKFIMWLRNPINLLISSYYFWLSNPNKIFDDNHRYVVSNKLCFSDFIDQSFTQNFVCNYFAKGMKLTDFYFVGIQEFFLEDLTYLKSNLGWNQFKIMTINRNRYENYQDKVMDILTNKSLVKNIVALNSADMELYQKALSLRVQREGLSNALEMYELSLKRFPSQLKNNC
ncbi:MAG: hypothetical protein ACRC62_02335 [Microcoleus sp.]